MSKGPTKWILLAAAFMALVTIFQNCTQQLGGQPFGTDTGNPFHLNSHEQPMVSDSSDEEEAPVSSGMTNTFAQGLAMHLCNRATTCGNIIDFDSCLHGVKTNQTFADLISTPSARDLNELEDLEKNGTVSFTTERRAACYAQVRGAACRELEGLEDSRTSLRTIFQTICE